MLNLWICPNGGSILAAGSLWHTYQWFRYRYDDAQFL